MFDVPSDSAESKRNRNFDLTQCVMADVTNAAGEPSTVGLKTSV